MSGSLQNFGGGSGGTEKFKTDVPVSLSGGKTLGKYPSGAVIHAKGKTPAAVLRDLATESIYPTYTPAALTLSASVPPVGEIGESVSGTVTAQFYRQDAGGLLDLRVLDATPSVPRVLKKGATAAQSVTVSLVRSAAGVAYVGQADYAAGQPKLVQPDGTPDPRPALVRSAAAPQAAEQNLSTAPLVLRGVYRAFFGPSEQVPTVNAQVRGLANRPLSSELGGSVILETGTQYRRFAVALPAGLQLRQVLDLTASGADLTSQYAPKPIQVEDAQGALVPYTLYAMEQAVVYNVSHQHKLIF